MKPVYRPFFIEKYKDILMGEEPADVLTPLESELDGALARLRDVGYAKHFYPSLAIVVLPMILLSLGLFIKYSWTYKLIPLLFLVIFLLYKRTGLNNLLLANPKPKSSEAVKTRIVEKVAYAEKGLNIKTYRIDFLQQLFIGFIPWIMVLAADLFLGPFTGMETLVMLFLAYLISTPLWLYYFKNDRSEIDEVKEVVAELKQAFFSIGA